MIVELMYMIWKLGLDNDEKHDLMEYEMQLVLLKQLEDMYEDE